MTYTLRGVLIVGLLGLGACSSNQSFLTKAGEAGQAGAGAAGAAGGPIAEGSIAYFNQTIGDTVQFQVDQSTLTPQAIALLDQQAGFLLENSQYTAVIEGHADEQGTRDYNLALGARRASAVLNYLVSKGVADTRLETVTYGKERPLAVCSDETCYSQNRRAVTAVAGGALGS